MCAPNSVLILRTQPNVFGQHLTSEIGAPQDYQTNKSNGTFPDSYDLRLPGAERDSSDDNKMMEVSMTRKAPASPPEREERKSGSDEVMRSATTSKNSSHYMPIKALNQFTADWEIKARVVKKAPIREWSNAKGTGQLLNFDLIDREGTMIQGTAFHEAAKVFDSLIETEGIYTFSNGQVKLANKRFTSIKNDYCITFGNDALVRRCEEDDEIESVTFAFTRLDQIESIVQQCTLDVIGVILDVGPTSTINLRDGKVKQKRSLTIGDESHVSIGVTFWGSVTEAHRFTAGQVIALKNCRVSDFNGKSLNASSHAEDIFLGSSLRHKRAQEI